MASFWAKQWQNFRLTKYKSLTTDEFEDAEKDSSVRRHLVHGSDSTSSLSSRSGSNSQYDNDDEERDVNRRSTWSTRSKLLVVVNLVIFFSSLALFFAGSHRQSSEPNPAYRKVSTWSPVLDDIEIPTVEKQVQGDLFPATKVEDQLLGRREPSPETDDLWLDYEIQRPFLLTREQVIQLGKDPEKTVKYPDDVFGLGPEAYMGGMDVFHVLHCFNTIRKEAFKDYYFDGEQYHMEGYGEESQPKRRHSELFWVHLRHCTDIIVQFLMCNADMTMTTMTWLETQERPWPDFSVNKKCVDFDTLVRWRDENALNISQAGLVRRPPGAPETKISEEYWRVVGNDTNPGDNRHHPIWD